MKRIVLSDGNRVNDKGFRVALGGLDLSRFTLNPVMLYNHNPERVIGRWEDVAIKNNRLEADPVFDTEDELGGDIARKYEKDFIRAASLYIFPIEVQYMDDVPVVTRSELIEASIVTIPSDAGAIRLCTSDGHELTNEQFKLRFTNTHNINQNKKTMQVTLTQKAIDALALSGSEITGKDVELAVQEKDREISALNAKISAMEKEQVSGYLSAAVKEGRITEQERGGFASLAEKDFAAVKQVIDARPQKAGASLAAQVQNPASAGVSSRQEWDYMKWMKEDPRGLQKLKSERPEEFEQLKETLKK